MEMNIRTLIVTITPQYAATLLQRKDPNRTLLKKAVDKYARQLIDGSWKVNGESVIVGENGELLDGQHRLEACVRTGIPFTTVLVEGIPASSMSTINTGKARSNGDVLSLLGYKNTTNLSSAVSVLWRHLKGQQLCNGVYPTTHEQEVVLQMFPTVEDSVRLFVSNHKLKGLGPVAVLSAMHFICSRANVNKAQTFFSGLETGIGLKSDDPILALRDVLLKSKTKSHIIKKDVLGAMVIKAWNLHYKGLTCKLLSWKQSGEAYPMIAGDSLRNALTSQYAAAVGK